MEKEPEIPNEAEGGGKKKKKKKSKKRGAGSTAKADKANNEGGTSKKQEKRKKLKTADKKSGGGGGTKMNRANRRLNDWNQQGNQEWRVEGCGKRYLFIPYIYFYVHKMSFIKDGAALKFV